MIILAGKIGSGKSVVARLLRLEGFGVYDCDAAAKIIMGENPDVKEALKRVCGEEIYDRDGKLCKRRLAEMIYGQEDVRKKVNETVHKAVIADAVRWCEADARNLFVETAIPAESGLLDMAEEVWWLESSPETKLSRVKQRDGRPHDEIEKIMKAQEQELSRIIRAGVKLVMIDNNGKHPLLPLIKKILEDIRN